MSQTHRFPNDALGTALEPVLVQLSKRHLMSYAAVMGALDSCYLDDTRPEGIIGLPTFTVVPEWRVMNGRSYRSILGADDACMWRCIHVQQDSRFLQPLRPGQPLSIRGRICALRQTRIGVYVAVRLDTVFSDTDTLATQSWFCGIFLGDELNGEGGTIEEPPALPSSNNDLADWHTLPEPVLTVSRALPHLYTEATAIWNPIHTERKAAHNAGLGDTLLHGTCTWGHAGLALIRDVAAGDPQRLTRLGARMVGKALVGDILSLRYKPLQVNGDLRLSFQVVNQAQTLILDDGIAQFSN